MHVRQLVCRMVFAMAVVGTAGCGSSKSNAPVGGGDDTTDYSDYWAGKPRSTPAVYTAGSLTAVTQGTVDATGGVVSAPEGGPLAGFTLTIPPGAVSAPTTFTFEQEDGGSFANLPAGQQAVVFSISSDGQHQFEVPLTVTFPFPDTARYPVAYYIQEDGKLGLMRQVPVG